jgi:hypothetical protein
MLATPITHAQIPNRFIAHLHLAVCRWDGSALGALPRLASEFADPTPDRILFLVRSPPGVEAPETSHRHRNEFFEAPRGLIA